MLQPIFSFFFFSETCLASSPTNWDNIKSIRENIKRALEMDGGAKLEVADTGYILHTYPSISLLITCFM